jgi:hypothetical protein
MSRLLLALLATTALIASGCRSTSPSSENRSASQPAAETKSAASDGQTTIGEDGRPHRYVKSRDGSFDGEIWGKPAKNSKFTRLQIGMTQSEVERLIGEGTDIRSYITGKAWIPFYHGTDAHRFETFYKGHGSLIYTGGNAFGGGRGVLVGINHDASEDGYQ